MKYIKLGATGLDISPIAIGGMTYGDPKRGHPVWSLPEKDSMPLIKYALEKGINFFDTANLYSQGSSEEILGRALKDFAAPIVGASKTSQLDDAIASLSITLTDEEIHLLEAPYTPRYDFQGISDDRELQRIMARIPGFTPSAS
jgi:aryl-alcohol dehydrogenase-like predicted oxidoreductase